MVKGKMVIASDRRERSNLVSVKRDCHVGPVDLLAMTVFIMMGFFLSSCSAPPAQIPEIPKEHPANKFYQAAQTGMLSDRVCLDNKGDPAIPAGEVKMGEKYTKLAELAPGVLRFHENATGKQYLGVFFLQRNGFLQAPKVCSWEEKK